MLDSEKVYRTLESCGVNFFTGVPDSLLGDFCSCIVRLSKPRGHVIAANEGNSVALAAGHYLATGKCPFLYFQNSGLGNVINPILSLADASVYSVPMLMLIGWRGEPGVKDEPQHIRQGEVTLSMLDVIDVPYYILPENESSALNCFVEAHERALAESRPVAIVARKGIFGPCQEKNQQVKSVISMTREQALRCILSLSEAEDVMIATTGKTSREVFELRDKYFQGRHQQDFLSVGSMGHCSQIALGIALAQSKRRVICLDGDGAALMHMGGMAIIGQSEDIKLFHIILNNGAHDSVGGQPTVAGELDVPALGKALGYKSAMSCESIAGLNASFHKLSGLNGPVLLEVKIALGSREDLGRPTQSPVENKIMLMQHLEGEAN